LHGVGKQAAIEMGLSHVKEYLPVMVVSTPVSSSGFLSWSLFR